MIRYDIGQEPAEIQKEKQQKDVQKKKKKKKKKMYFSHCAVLK